MNKHHLLSTIIFLIGMSFITSCVKKSFDDPPEQWSYDPKLTVTHSIWDLKKLYYDNGNQPLQVTEDMTISGTVVADDRSGNFYKQIIIQDTSSGITVLLNRSSGLYNDYPIGRKIYIKCKGLYIGAYGNFIQIGGGIDPTNALYEIPANLMERYIVKANYPNLVTPKKVNIADIIYTNSSQTEFHRRLLGTLVELDSVEFPVDEIGLDYALDPNVSSGTDRTIEDCVGKSIVLRNSGYSQFRTANIPAGRGSFVGVLSTYETGTKKTPQLLIRDTTDINFSGPRCGGVVIGPTVHVSIDSIRKLYNGTGILLGSLKIKGIVTSSVADSNISKGNMFVQDNSGKGIYVYFGSAYHGFKLGDSIELDLSNDSLIVYRETLEIKGKQSQATKLGTGNYENNITPVVVTIGDLNADLNNPVYKDRKYESVLLKIQGNNLTITNSAGTYAGNSGQSTLTDNTGSIILYTRTAANFSGQPVNAAPASIICLGTKFNTTNEVVIRKASDIQ